ncbi:MAG: CocE/NonD family hydrolase [Nitrospinota bacterium]
MPPLHVNPESIRTVNPSTWPQYPYNDYPKTPEQSPIRYSIFPEYAKRLPMRDGTELAYDVYRPFAPGEKFPALLSWSPYTRQLQQTLAPIGQNEAGLTEFWVPRGYAQVIADVRGSNDSGGAWDHWGPQEQADLKETIEFIAQQPWCNGKVGMIGCSYFGMSQLLGAEQQPEGLAAIFPYDAMTDLYRDAYYHGGISSVWARFWFQDLAFLNFTSGRLKDPSGFRYHFNRVLSGQDPLDGPYYQERSSGPNLHKVKTPAYFGCDWIFFGLHLRGAFLGWENVPPATPKKMLIGQEPKPRRPFAAYHVEALRWYDHHLKGLDSGVWEGAPINLYIQGEDTWRGEREWPIARTEWRELYLTPQGGFSEGPGPSGELRYTHLPGTREVKLGEPKLVWRTEPAARPFEVTGPLVLKLTASLDQADTHWFAFLKDEAPDGTLRLLTRGWLKASHRALDPQRSKPWRPWHPHDRVDPLTPGEAAEYLIEIIPTSNCFREGHRMRLELSASDPATDLIYTHEPFWQAVTHTIHLGRGGSRLLTPFIPR